MNFIVTSSGREIDFENLANADFQLVDVVESLKKINRFTGHTKQLYSVLDHSIECCIYAKIIGWDKEVQLACLLHDCHEAYIGDISTPVKIAVPAIQKFERMVEHHFHTAMGISDLMLRHADSIKLADIALLIAERRAMLPAAPTTWSFLPIAAGYEYSYVPISYGSAGPEAFWECLEELYEVLPAELRAQTVDNEITNFHFNRCTP